MIENTSSSSPKRRGRPRTSPLTETVPQPGTQPQSIENLTKTCIETLQIALQQTKALARERLRQKRSDTRIRNVGREIQELLKVMTRYCQN